MEFSKAEKLFPLGFGFMRLPTNSAGAQVGKIDREPSRAMMRRAFDAGINYFDTAMPYHDGESEVFLSEEMTPEMKEKVVVATKLPTWLVQSPADLEKFLDKQLKTFRTERIDVYLLHALNLNRWEKMKQVGVLEFLDKAKKAGKIGSAGFSFHDSLPLFKDIVDSYKWDVAQIQLNILDAGYQAGLAGAKYAHQSGAFVVIMEPLKGGLLGMEIQGAFADIAKKYGWQKQTFVDLCLRWLWSQPEVGLVLSGMSNMQQLDENIISAAGKLPLSENELKLVEEVRDEYARRVLVGCTGCAYCRGCPRDVDILECFRLLNTAAITGDWKGRQAAYNKVLFPPEKAEKRASECVECGICEEKCPQNIPIREKLKDVVKAFEETTY